MVQIFSKITVNIITVSFHAESLVTMNSSAISVGEGRGELCVCVDSGMTASVNSTLRVILSTIEGLASKLHHTVHRKFMRVSNSCIFMRVIRSRTNLIT